MEPDITARLTFHRAFIPSPEHDDLRDVLQEAVDEIIALRSVISGMGVRIEEGETWLSAGVLEDPDHEQAAVVLRAYGEGLTWEPR